MKKIITIITLLAVVGFGISSIVKASTDVVTATVTIAAATVSLDVDAFVYGKGTCGSLTLGTSDQQKFSEILCKDSAEDNDGAPAIITATVGSTGTDLNITGANATGSGDNSWSIEGTAGVDEYVHKFKENASWVALTTEAVTLKEEVLAAGTVTFDLEIFTPTVVGTAEEMSIPVTVTAVASE